MGRGYDSTRLGKKCHGEKMKALLEALAYLRERFSPALFVPLTLLLAVPSFLNAGSGIKWKQLVWIYLWILWTLFFLRLWDDLASLGQDRLRHPFRVLVRSKHLFFFRVVCASGLFLSFLGLASPVLFRPDEGLLARFFWQAGLLGAIILGLGVLYSSRSFFKSEWKQIGFFHLLLLKYPILAAVFAGRDLKTLVLAGLIYLLVNLYEFAHDSRHRASRYFRAVAFVEAGIFAVLLVCELRIQIG